MATDVELAYLAGFFDGEGCIQVVYSRPEQLALNVSVNQIVRQPLDMLAEMFGGVVHARVATQPGRRPFYFWRVGGLTAERLLRAFRPYLTVKAAEADLGIAFQELLRQPAHRPRNGWELAERDSYRLALRDLKRADGNPYQERMAV